MVACELLLFLNLVSLGIYVVYTDIRLGVVKNVSLLYSLFAGIIVNIFYYYFFARAFLGLFLINLLVIIITSVLLYAKHFWGGGDSKLLICLTLLIPGRLYDVNENVPGLICLIIVFLIAYLYVIIDSLYELITKEHFTKGQRIRLQDLSGILRDYLVTYFVMRLIFILGLMLVPEFCRDNTILVMFVNIMIIWWLAEHDLQKNKLFVSIVGILTITSFFFEQGRDFRNLIGVVKSSLIILIFLMLRYFVSGYNYKEIKTSEVKRGMILSTATVLLFGQSRIKGLPLSTTEDMGDRITEAQAEAIHRWGKSKNGKETVVIVKKIPFAIFLVLGTFLYIILRIAL